MSPEPRGADLRVTSAETPRTVSVPRLLTVGQVASHLRCSKRQVFLLLQMGYLPRTRIGVRTVRVLAVDLANYIEHCRRRAE